MEPKETPPKANDEDSKLPVRTEERTSEGFGSTTPEEETGALQEAILPSPGTTNHRRPEAEQRKSISLQQELPCEVNNSTIQQPTRSGTPSLAYANPTLVGAISAKEVCILPNNAIVPLRDILDGGLSLGDSHLTNHCTLPKKKQKRPRTTAEVDSFFTPPQSPTKTAIGVTLGDTNQNSVPKTTPRIERQSPQRDDFPQDSATMNSSGGRSIHSTRERETHDLTVDNTPSNNALGNFVEGLPGRVSFLTKQKASSKGVLEGGSSALNVSKRPKSIRPLVSAPSNVSSQSLGNMSKEMQIDRGFVGGPIQSHPKRVAKEAKRRSLSDLRDFNPTELELPIQETVKDPKTWNISAEATTNEQQEGNNAKRWSSEKKKTSEVIVPFSNHDPASIGQTGTLGEGSHPTGPDKKANNNNPNHEELALPKRLLRKVDNKTEKEDLKNLTNQNNGVSPKVSNTQSHQMNHINRSYKSLQGDVTPNHLDVMSTRNNDAKIVSGGSSVPKATSQRDNAMKKNPKLMMAQNVFTQPASGPENKEASTREVSEGPKTKRMGFTDDFLGASKKSDGEKNQGNKDNTLVPNVTRKGHVSKQLGYGQDKQGSSSKMDEPIGVTESSSIVDLPVPDHMK